MSDPVAPTFPTVPRVRGRFIAGQAPGRQVGTKNKATRSIREAFVQAFDMLGGADALAAWGRENPTPFYALASKLIPTEITGPDGSQLLGVVVLPPLGQLAAGDGEPGSLPAPPADRLERIDGLERAELIDDGSA